MKPHIRILKVFEELKIDHKAPDFSIEKARNEIELKSLSDDVPSFQKHEYKLVAKLM